MSKAPSLFHQPSDFNERKRQSMIFELYYKHYSQWFMTDMMETNNENIRIGQSLKNAASLYDAYETAVLGIFDFLILQYTAGEPIDSLQKQLTQVVGLYEEKAKYERIVKDDSNYPAFDLAHIDDYVRYVGLLSIAVLMHRKDLIPRIYALIADSEFDREDALVEELLTPYLPDRPYIDEWFHDEEYAALMDATAGETPEEKLEDLKTFLSKWYQNMKGTGWYDAHRDLSDEGGGGYFGYWAWEAGAIAYLHKLDDSDIDSMYYPKDLVAYARALDEQAAEQPQAQAVAQGASPRLRCEGGQPCPQAGYWSTPASNVGRKHYQQGEVMPDLAGNDWGHTIWYYEGGE